MAKLVYGIRPENVHVFQYFLDCNLAPNQGHGIIGIVVAETEDFQALGEFPVLTHEMWEIKDGLEEHSMWVQTKFRYKTQNPQFYIIN